MIVFVQLNNDFSGSPKILRDTLRIMQEHNIPHKCFVSNSSASGFLSDQGIIKEQYWYKRSESRFVTFLNLLASQTHLFFRLLFDREVSSGSVIYVNTLLPFGANLYAFLTRKKLICHVHEISLTPTVLKNCLIFLNRISSSFNIFVSKAHCDEMPMHHVRHAIVHNSLDERMMEMGGKETYDHTSDGKFVVLMLSSPARYKGFPELLLVARSLQEHRNIRFELVLNCSAAAVADLRDSENIPSNLTIHPASESVENYYCRASLLLNLSRPDMWVETFGMTILEAMAFGLPVIVPPVGGPMDLVSSGVEGYLIDSRNVAEVSAKIHELSSNQELCQEMSIRATEKARKFNVDRFRDNMLSIVAREVSD